MKAAKATAPETTLLQLITRSFTDDNDPDTVTTSQVPHALWEQALLRPLRDFLLRPSKGSRARLVELGYRLGGGIPGTHPPELPLVVESLHAGSLIVDDIEDDSDLRRDAAALHRVYGVPVALNAGNWLYFWPQVLLSRMPLTDEARLRAHERVAECLMRGHQGQALDLTVRVDELPQAEVPAVVDAIARLKTGSLLGLATALGAIAAGAPSERLDAIDSFGRAVGVGLQMLDDLSGVVSPARRDKALEDLKHGRATWVWAWLACDLDASVYQPLRAELQGRSIGGAMEALVGRLRFRLGTSATERVRSYLRQATDALRDAVGDGDWVDDVRYELSWLESHFLEAGQAPAVRAVRHRGDEASRGRTR